MKKKVVITTLTVLSLIMTLLTVYALIPLQSSVGAVKPVPPLTVLPPLSIPKFTNELTGPPPVYIPTIGATGYEVFMEEFDQQILPTMTFPGGAGPEDRLTKVWGYGGKTVGDVYIQSSPGPSFDVNTLDAIQVKYYNLINNRANIQFAVDPTLHWANPLNMPMPMPPDPLTGQFNPFPDPGYPDAQNVVPLVPHLHGGEVAPTADGGPDAWWTSGGYQGPGFSSSIEPPMNAPTPPAGANWAVFDYPNTNPASTLWYHDHALGVTRLNVMSGLAGFYIVRDTSATSTALAGITGKYDMPLVFQDRNFDPTGQLLFPSLGVQPAVHPYWIPEFFGEVIMVNGKAWPNMNVDDEVYRFRLLDGSNARFYTISFEVTGPAGNPFLGTNVPFKIIASDGGYLANPVQRGQFGTIDPLAQFTFAPGERVEILIDFSPYPLDTQILVKNTANENFPFGLPVNPLTAGMVMQFTVKPDPVTTGPIMPTLPTPLNPTLQVAGSPIFPTLIQATPTGATHAGVGYYRMLTLVEVLDPVTKVPLELLLDGQKWYSYPTEGAQVGSTEEWIIYNPTADSHPIHLHLVQFQLISRQTFNAKAYYDDWLKANGGVLPLTAKTLNAMAWPNQYKVGPAVGPLPEEQGWKDTIMVHPGQITTIRVRYAPTGAAETPGLNPFTEFDPTLEHGPGIPGKYPTGLPYGYVWHCHIIDHEDNEMMRPLMLVKGFGFLDAPFGTYAAPPTWLVGKQKMPPFA